MKASPILLRKFERYSWETEQLTTVLDKFIERFGDSLFIKHSPIIHQEGMSTLLIYKKQDLPMPSSGNVNTGYQWLCPPRTTNVYVYISPIEYSYEFYIQ